MSETEKEPGKEKKEKKKPKRDRQSFPWEDHDFPSLEERTSAPKIVEAQMDSKRLATMRAARQKKVKAALGEDPATLNRRWMIHISITGIENTTNDDWDAFCAFSLVDGKDDRTKRNRLHNKFRFTKSYVVKSGDKRQFKKSEVVMEKAWDGSYIGLKRQEVAIDLWLRSSSNFNQLLGTARKSLYDLANDIVFQSCFVKPVSGAEGPMSTVYNIGSVNINAVVSEVYQFTIMASNWQFMPRPEFSRLEINTTAMKKLRIAMPAGPDEPPNAFESAECQGPVYCWQKAGQFVYKGTKVGLSTEAMTISLYSAGALQGRAVVSLGIVGVHPIAIGSVKAVSQNPDNFLQGKVGGSLSMVCKSLLLGDNVHDEDPSIPAPLQPDTSLVVYHLSPKMQYLIVDVFACDGLPIADPDYGSSNAFVQVKFDNMVQQSPVVYASLSPTWNHRFYIPVRVTDEQLRTKPEFYKQLLPREMESKGYLQIEIWHFDSVPTEFLGEFKLDLHQTRYGKQAKKAVCELSLRAQVQDEEGKLKDDDEQLIGVHPGLSRKQPTLVYEGRREKLSGSLLQTLQRATVSFDAYFIPDFPSDFKYNEQPVMRNEDPFQECYEKWDSNWANFLETYGIWFPDANINRRFQSRFNPTAGEQQPLPKLITPLALPAPLASPLMVQHWVRCIEFHTRPRQRSSSEIRDWQQPENILSLRRGTVQDHAVLLCCALLGLGRNAFVCKGTVQGGKDHAWVMTREAHNGTVTFWETCTGAKFHLADRWVGDPTRGADTNRRIEERWKGRVGKYDLLSQEGKKAWKKDTAKRQGLNRQDQLKRMADLTGLPISPWKELYAPEAVVVVPYESIEIVFNGSQVWGNLGSHHPACIYYDMEDDTRSWLPLISGPGEAELHVGKEVAIPVGPAMSKVTCEQLENSIEAEIEESVRMIRMRQGKDSSFHENRRHSAEGPAKDADLLEDCLQKYVQLLEEEMKLESDWCYDSKDQLLKPWGTPSPLNSQIYMQQCRGEWNKYWKKKDALKTARAYLPVKDNHVLSGVPLHISSTDLKVIRKDLMDCRLLQEYFELELEEAPFFCVVKVFPMPSSVLSVWIFFGAEVPMSKDRVLALAQDKMKKFMATDLESSEESEEGEEELKRARRKRKKKKGKCADDEIKD